MLQHYFNGLHIYCRLMDMGIPRGFARKAARLLEAIIHPLIYGGRNGL